MTKQQLVELNSSEADHTSVWAEVLPCFTVNVKVVTERLGVFLVGRNITDNMQPRDLVQHKPFAAFIPNPIPLI